MNIEIDSAADQIILSTLREGNLRQAANLIVRHHATTVHGVCLGLVPDPGQAEELTHETFCRAFVALPGFRQQGSPRAWLVELARSQCRAHLARREAAAGEGAALTSLRGMRSRSAAGRLPDSLQRRLEVLATSL